MAMLKQLKLRQFGAKVKSNDFRVRKEVYCERALLLALGMPLCSSILQAFPLFPICQLTNPKRNCLLAFKTRDTCSFGNLLPLSRSRINCRPSTSCGGLAGALESLAKVCQNLDNSNGFREAGTPFLCLKCLLLSSTC